MKNKNQHYVTEAYLKAWCDPITPNGAFVWAINKIYKKVFRKSPKTLFTEKDFYTVINAEGERLIALEDRLADIESAFISLRKNKLEKRIQLDYNDKKIISLFASTMYSRTSLQKSEQKEIWSEWFETTESLPVEYSRRVKQHPVFDQISQLSTQPMPYHMFHFVNLIMPYIVQMTCTILETEDVPGFITSDNPCFWFDPAIFDPTKPMTFFGVGSPTLNILLPISPKQLISLEINGQDGYRPIDSQPGFIDTLNQLTTWNSDELNIVNQKTIKEVWFQQS